MSLNEASELEQVSLRGDKPHEAWHWRYIETFEDESQESTAVMKETGHKRVPTVQDKTYTYDGDKGIVLVFTAAPQQ